MSTYLRDYTNDQSRFLVLDQALVHYRDEGQGDVVVLLHGAFSSLHTFDQWAEELKGQFRVIRLDLPGFGLSGSSSDHTYSVRRYLIWLEQFLDRLGIKKCHIAGNSLGGLLAWEFTLMHPERVDQLILINSAGYLRETALPLPFMLARMPFLGKFAKHVISRPLVSMFIKQVYADPAKVSEKTVDRYFDLFSREGNPEAFISIANEHLQDKSHLLPFLPHSTLILWGEQDSWIPVKFGYKFLKDIPNSQLVIYEDAGHIPMEEVPETSALDVQRFLAGLPIAS
ncbi:alpha/beta hydrolase [Pontibacter sp. G13]|uniref:alpha/beta fold hydrolase n=1 Tax=Pontibacter sp. G13 TaxID=3074898 RepID=UPI00288C0FC0|nr:alpha/beta hydrolase [Pontibacter sp. G13]WNJ16027.1 alpha/beta hydrolase [Pontibacter sp. G13]